MTCFALPQHHLHLNQVSWLYEDVVWTSLGRSARSIIYASPSTASRSPHAREHEKASTSSLLIPGCVTTVLRRPLGGCWQYIVPETWRSENGLVVFQGSGQDASSSWHSTFADHRFLSGPSCLLYHTLKVDCVVFSTPHRVDTITT